MKSNLFFTSDTHFGHEAILRFDSRPFESIDEHDAEIISRWNSVVPPTGTIYHLGDFAYRSKRPIEWYLESLNGRIHLVRGNHDDDNGKNCAWRKRDLFASAQKAAYIKMQGIKMYLLHYPCRVWRTSNHGSLHLYGHCHGSLPMWGRSMDVGVTEHDFYPWSFEEIVDKLGNRPLLYQHSQEAPPNAGTQGDKKWNR